MAVIKFTKNELRSQQIRLSQLEKYLPTLQLKKALLQAEVYEARLEIQDREYEFQKAYDWVAHYAELLTERSSINPERAAKISQIKKSFENVAGVDIPCFQGIVFEEYAYGAAEEPLWIDSAISGLRAAVEAKVRLNMVREKKEILEKEHREVSIRVNLFEKILIPRASNAIKKIKIFLGDQQLAAVSQAKAAKRKIEEHQALLEIGGQHAL